MSNSKGAGKTRQTSDPNEKPPRGGPHEGIGIDNTGLQTCTNSVRYRP